MPAKPLFRWAWHGRIMIERYFLKPQTRDRIQACWLGEPIQRYVTWLDQRGYAARNVFRRVPLLLHFAQYAQTHGANAWGELPAQVGGFVEYWVRERNANYRSERAQQALVNNVRNPIEQMLRLILPDFVGSRRGYACLPFADQVPGFFTYLREERGLRPATVGEYRLDLASFESYLKGIKLAGLRELSPTILSAFITERGQHWGKSMVKGACGVLRVFLRYLYREGLLSRDLSQSVETPRQYRCSDLPRAISWEEVQRMLEVVDRRTTGGKRDYAILLLLVTYGLRSREVAALTLNCLDWEQGRLRVPERKAGHSTAYPLASVVGEAILDYLQHGRPKTGDRHLFFRVLAPHDPLTATAVSIRTSWYLRKAGIPVPRPGSHTLRHTCIQRLVDAHFPLKTIGDYVGHRSPDSTANYAKVSLEALRQVALGDGEEVL